MNAYEALLDEACDMGLTVKEKPLKFNNGRIKGNRIAIRQDIDTEKEKACVLAEELGHYYTSVGNILDMTVPENPKTRAPGAALGIQSQHRTTRSDQSLRTRV